MEIKPPGRGGPIPGPVPAGGPEGPSEELIRNRDKVEKTVVGVKPPIHSYSSSPPPLSQKANEVASRYLR